MENTKVKSVGFDRSKTKSGILHIGVGNFHRAHEEFYTNELLALDPSQGEWAITGAMLLPSDEKLYNALKDQDGVYTVTVCGRDGKDQAYEIGTLKEVIWAQKEPKKVIAKIADPETRIVSMTITEGGYNIDKETGEFDLSNEAVKRDLENPSSPSTVFGYIAEGLRKRRDADAGKVTILTCDNLQHNGNTAKKAFMGFIKAQDPELARWAEENVTFPNSMVDRITPATRPEDVERLNKMNGTSDKAPVYCEDFIQWVVEDNFANGRPRWEEVGVEFTDDVAPYENMKLSLLNASHSLLSYPSFLSGYRKVDEAMKDERIRKFVRDFMDVDITPYVPAPGNTDLEEYKQTLIERFSNSSVSDQVARLCYDGLAKFPVYLIPNVTKMVRDGKDLTRVAYLFAAYYDYLKYHTDDNGVEFEVAEPWMDSSVEQALASSNPLDFLDIAAFAGAGLRESKAFTDLYLRFVKEIREKGAMKTLETII
ncbi:MAG: mannitol dehydrogenase family protein [Muribaculaceae bacterium]|nr:mannitol dehydrogenase family protein [Muribaculaceae bacterium]